MENTSTNNLPDLKAAREAKGISLEDVFTKTRVRVAYLQAIENREYHLLPVPVYSNNFIKIYAKFLEVDSEPIIKDYNNYLGSQKETQPLPEEEIPEEKFNFGEMLNRKTYWVIASVVIVMIVLYWFVSSRDKTSSNIVDTGGVTANLVQQNKEQTAQPSVNPAAPVAPVSPQVKVMPAPPANVVKQQLPVASPAASVAGANKEAMPPKQVSPPVKNIPAPAVSEDAGLLVIKATEETWMRVKADQNPSFQVVLKSGEKLERRAAKFSIDIGNAGGVKVQFKGKNVENLGKPGEVVHLRLPLNEKIND